MDSKYFSYLDSARNNGIDKMQGIINRMQNEFPELSNIIEAKSIYGEWIRTFSSRHPGQLVYKQ